MMSTKKSHHTNAPKVWDPNLYFVDVGRPYGDTSPLPLSPTPVRVSLENVLNWLHFSRLCIPISQILGDDTSG